MKKRFINGAFIRSILFIIVSLGLGDPVHAMEAATVVQQYVVDGNLVSVADFIHDRVPISDTSIPYYNYVTGIWDQTQKTPSSPAFKAELAAFRLANPGFALEVRRLYQPRCFREINWDELS